MQDHFFFFQIKFFFRIFWSLLNWRVPNNNLERDGVRIVAICGALGPIDAGDDSGGTVVVDVTGGSGQQNVTIVDTGRGLSVGGGEVGEVRERTVGGNVEARRGGDGSERFDQVNVDEAAGRVQLEIGPIVELDRRFDHGVVGEGIDGCETIIACIALLTNAAIIDTSSMTIAIERTRRHDRST